MKTKTAHEGAAFWYPKKLVISPSTEAAGRAGLHRARLVDREVASAKILTVPRLNGLLDIAIVGHFDEAEAARASRHLIDDDRGGRHCSYFLKCFFQFSI